MYKFFVNNEQIKDNIVRIIGEDVNHIKNVLRLQIEEKIFICNKETFKSYKSKIIKIDKEVILCEMLEESQNSTESNIYIHIFQGLPKVDKFEFIIEKCTEIGVKEITPVIMKRTVVKLDDKDKIKKVTRWQKIAEVAAKQSKRDAILKVNNLTNFKNIFEKAEDYDILLVAYEKEEITKLKEILYSYKNREIIKVAIIIGPEGGIDDEEIDICKNNNFTSITLGKRILRTETAPLVISSNILYELEE